jgi:uncharacterized protein
MRKMIAIMAALAAPALNVAPAMADDAYTPFVRQSIEGYIRPAFESFAADTAALPPAIDAACADSSQETKADFANRYKAVVRSFGGVSFLRYGPLIENHRLDRLAFMPDPRGIAQRQIRKVFAENDETVTDPVKLHDKSVALQGLTALQLIAFDKNGNVALGDPGDKQDFICAYASAISRNVAKVASDINAEWQDEKGYSLKLISPGADTGQIRSPKEAIETIFNSLVTGLIVIKDQELLPTVGTEKKKAKAHRLPFSRSGNGTAYLIAELTGIKAALEAANFSPALDEEFKWIPGSLAFEFGNGIANLQAIDTPVRQSIKSDDTYERLTLLTITIDSLRDTMAQELAGALELSGGFNALDGD